MYEHYKFVYVCIIYEGYSKSVMLARQSQMLVVNFITV